MSSDFQSSSLIAIENDPNITYFGRYLDMLMKRSALSQGRLARLSIKVLSDYNEARMPVGLLPIQPDKVGVSQSTINKLLIKGQMPSYEQVIVLVEALKRWYSSDTLKKLCRQASEAYGSIVHVPEFTHQDENYLFILATYAPPTEVVKAMRETSQLQVAALPVIESSPIHRRIGERAS